ncbi:hypothetical protein [Sinomonas atrocyanea]
MDQFQANLRALGRAALVPCDGESAEELLERIQSAVPYPDNPFWSVAAEGWAAAAAPAPVRVASCTELPDGARIEARVAGTVHFAGNVTHALPGMDLFWAVSPTGDRRLIEFRNYEVYRH